MRFSSLAVVISVLVAVPLAAAAVAPMNGAAFVQSARCTAAESVAGEASFDQARVNAEARRQSAANVEAARAAIAEVTARAREQDLSMVRAAACGAA